VNYLIRKCALEDQHFSILSRDFHWVTTCSPSVISRFVPTTLWHSLHAQLIHSIMNSKLLAGIDSTQIVLAMKIVFPLVVSSKSRQVLLLIFYFLLVTNPFSLCLDLSPYLKCNFYSWNCYSSHLFSDHPSPISTANSNSTTP